MISYIQKGCNWFAINNQLAFQLIKNENLINYLCKYTRCADEIFVQTIIVYLHLENTVYMYGRKNCSANALRYIDWNRGLPYVFQKEDINELLNAPADCLFARKFNSIEVIKEIIRQISE